MTQPDVSAARWLPWRWLRRRRYARLHMESNYHDAQRRRIERLSNGN